ncbi:glycosyltransferase [Leuconostoc holzapfelii]|uniref:Glycosyltransferase n=1 Tax=Leuconostoc holzapfelii TaxID=434464 RepID=A0ABT2NSX7_9LACO|nr:glycosyltransferase [Leuconostoc holzapfelii]MCT8388494.1 glycosyltransferase [Leuconostoc holzapfelii]
MKPSKILKKYSVNIVLVTYNPNIADLFKNIRQSIDGVDSVILVDNASTPDIQTELYDYSLRNEKIKFLPMQNNNGIGAAQNEAIRFVSSHKNDEEQFLLFFDQDSYLTNMQIYDLTQHFIEESKETPNLALLGVKTNDDDTVSGRQFVKHIISSGSLTTLTIFKKIGFFDEELFIDFIDFAWCWKAEKLGYRLMVDNSMLLHHQTSGHLPTIFGKGIDKPSRLYYVYRNVIISLKRYNTSFLFSFKWYTHLFLKAIFQLIFAGERMYRGKMILSGIFDGLNGKTGK